MFLLKLVTDSGVKV